jgi:hypothetical protein
MALQIFQILENFGILLPQLLQSCHMLTVSPALSNPAQILSIYFLQSCLFLHIAHPGQPLGRVSEVGFDFLQPFFSEDVADCRVLLGFLDVREGVE